MGLNASRRGSFSAVIERKPRKKKILSSVQSFDQKSVFSTSEPSSANIVAKVTSIDPFRARINSVACPSQASREFDIELRNRADTSTSKSEIKTQFRRHLDTSKADPLDGVLVGDTLELEATLCNLEEDRLYPWSFSQISKKSSQTLQLVMAEMPATLLQWKGASSNSDAYRVAIAMTGESTPISSVMDNFAMLREYLGNKRGLQNGFILRGPKREGSKELVGVSCFRSRDDDAENRSDDEVLLNFMKVSSPIFINTMCPETPWEILPLYVVPVQSHLRTKMDTIVNRYPHMNVKATRSHVMQFSHCNIVLNFSEPGKASVSHFNVSRKTPITLETCIPPRARETKLPIHR